MMLSESEDAPCHTSSTRFQKLFAKQNKKTWLTNEFRFGKDTLVTSKL